MPRPLQNRVAPDGTLHAVSGRGLLMGNRGGRLHGEDRTLGRARWKSRAWIACITCFRGRQRQVWGASYTELFFLDEATALAAGHRPCFECRRADAEAFATACGLPRAAAIDAALHAERLGPRDRMAYGDVPPGSMFVLDGFRLRTAAGAPRWSFDGYAAAAEPAPREMVEMLTPATARAALAQGYRPHLHPTAVS